MKTRQEEKLELLKKLNVSVVATASSYALDKNVDAVINTINSLNSNNIDCTGTCNDKIKPVIVDKNNIKVGVISYTTYTNKLSENNEYLLNVYDKEIVKQDIEYLKENDVDYIISYLNVPNENSEYANSKQIKITDELFYLGVDVVLGSGSMVVQETVDDDIELNGKSKHVYAIYSLGSLFRNDENDDHSLSVIANFNLNKEILRDKDGNILSYSINLEINNPIRVWTKLNSNYNNGMYIIDNEIEKYNEGKSNFTSKEYEKMIEENNKIIILFKE